MQVQNFECQIAKAQIGRYVGGDKLSDDTIEQLEAHISKCPDCKQNLAERRTALQAMLSLGSEETAPHQGDAPKVKFDLASFIRSKVQSRQTAQAVVQTDGAKPVSFTKPALYSLALGAVLIGMSYASKNLGSVFGPTAAEGTSAKPATTEQQPHPAAKTNAPAPKKIADPLTKVQAGATVEPSDLPSKPHATASVPAKTKISSEHDHSRSRTHRAPRHESNTIRVYEPEN